MIRWSTEKDNITLVNTYAPNIGAPKYIKWILVDIKGEIDKNTIQWINRIEYELNIIFKNTLHPL